MEKLKKENQDMKKEKQIENFQADVRRELQIKRELAKLKSNAEKQPEEKGLLEAFVRFLFCQMDPKIF